MTRRQIHSTFDSAPVIISALVISAIGALFYNVLPLFLGVAQDYRQLGNRQIGFVSVAFFIGYNAVTIWAFFWIRKWNWRVTTWIALPMAFLGLLAAAWSDNFWLLLSSTALAGGGFAAVYGIGTTIIADTSNPARWYGFKIAGEAFPGALLLFLLPQTLIPQYGLSGMVYGMLIACVVLIPFLLTLPAHGLKSLDNDGEYMLTLEPASIDRRPIWYALAATLLFFTAASGIWAFIERMGHSLGFEQETIGTLLAVTLFFATGGSLATAWLGERFGNIGPFIVSAGAFLLSLLALSTVEDFTSYAAGTCVLTFAVGAGLPFAVAEVAELDVDGRFVILSVPAIGMGAMIGPGVAGVLAESGNFTPMLLAAGLSVLASTLLMRASQKLRQARD